MRRTTAMLWYLTSMLGLLLLAGARSLYVIAGQGGAAQGPRPDAPQAAPPPPQTPIAPDEDDGRRRKRRRLLIISGLGLVLIANAAFGTCYFLTRTPVTQLPVVKALTRDVAPHFLFSIYGVNRPGAVALSPDGDRLYVVERGGERLVRIYDRVGKPLGHLPPPSEELGLRSPRYVTVDAEGQVYVSDRMQLKVLVYSPEGELIDEIGDPDDGGIWAPLGLSAGSGGELYVTEASTERQRIVVLDALGDASLVFGEEGDDPGMLSFANGVIADDQGRIFVSNGNNSRLDSFDARGEYVTAFGNAGSTALSLPRGLALDDQDRLYVADAIGHNVAVFDVAAAEPSLLFTIGSYGIADGQLRFPNDVAVDGIGHVFVADRENNRVGVWSY